MKIQDKNNQILIYRSKDGKINLDVKLKKESVWLTQKQIALLFEKQRPAITKHLKNIFEDGELIENSVCSILEHTAADGKTYNTKYYNLDIIISVGYRVNSKKATQFRIWATRTLRNHIIKGYTINEKRLKDGRDIRLNELEETIGFLRRITNQKQLDEEESQGILKVITDYTNSWITLQKYDEGSLKIRQEGKIIYSLDYALCEKEIGELKQELIKTKQATDIFGVEREKSLEGIIGNLKQTFSGKNLYKSIEERASHLLYFIIKDHPFIDGNKRIASFLFIIFLVKNNYLYNKQGERKISDNTLTSLALLVASSNPKEKEVMVALITNLLNQ